jgi:hypothetical protein
VEDIKLGKFRCGSTMTIVDNQIVDSKPCPLEDDWSGLDDKLHMIEEGVCYRCNERCKDCGMNEELKIIVKSMRELENF